MQKKEKFKKTVFLLSIVRLSNKYLVYIYTRTHTRTHDIYTRIRTRIYTHAIYTHAHTQAGTHAHARTHEAGSTVRLTFLIKKSSCIVAIRSFIVYKKTS